MFNVVLIEPEIPPNTGNIARLCLATQSRLHLVEPLGFSVNDRQLRRAGMDYWQQVDVQYWKSLTEFEVRDPPSNSTISSDDESPSGGIGRRSFAREIIWCSAVKQRGCRKVFFCLIRINCLTIPMEPEARSLNLATAVAIVLFEGVRQLHSKL